MEKMKRIKLDFDTDYYNFENEVLVEKFNKIGDGINEIMDYLEKMRMCWRCKK